MKTKDVMAWSQHDRNIADRDINPQNKPMFELLNLNLTLTISKETNRWLVDKSL